MGAENQGSMCSRRGRASNIVHRLLRWLNYTVIAASTVSIICMLALRIVPTAWGWFFLTFAFFAIATAIVGCISTSLSARGATCFTFHMFLLITSICIQGALFLLLLTRPDGVLNKLRSNRSEYDGKVVLKVDAVLVIWVFCVQLIVLAMACMLHYCEPVDYYVDLEGDARPTRRSNRRLSRVQEESIADAQAEAAFNAKKESKSETEASRLHREMKEKYSQKKEETFDNVEI